MLADYVFAASTREAQAFAELGAPSYAYRFTRAAPGSDPIKVGAFHSADSPMRSGLGLHRPALVRSRPDTVRPNLEQHWTNFANTWY